MEMMPPFQRLRLLLPVVAFAALFGCENYVVVTTATKFGIDITQVAKEPPKVLIGYKREETSIIPAEHQNAESGPNNEKADTYSVLAEFCVMANPSLWDFFDSLSSGGRDVPDGLQIRSFFATGIAAVTAAKSVQMRQYFRDNVLERTSDKRKDKRCF